MSKDGISRNRYAEDGEFQTVKIRSLFGAGERTTSVRRATFNITLKLALDKVKPVTVRNVLCLTRLKLIASSIA